MRGPLVCIRNPYQVESAGVGVGCVQVRKSLRTRPASRPKAIGAVREGGVCTSVCFLGLTRTRRKPLVLCSEVAEA